MIDVTTAVRKASQYFKEIEKALNDSEPKNLRLEEIEKAEDRWLITLGYDVLSALAPKPSIFNKPPSPGDEWKYVREYKCFRIDANTGEVESMKIRKV